MAKFKKATSYFDVAAEKAEERQQKIVESASEPQKPAPQVRKAGRPKKGAEGASERLVQLSVYLRKTSLFPISLGSFSIAIWPKKSSS